MKRLIVIVVTMMLCCQVHAQSVPKYKPNRKSAPTSGVPNAEHQLSKEFVLRGRTVVASFDRLNLQFYSDDQAWTPRDVLAEKNVDNLDIVAEIPAEKQIAERLRATLNRLQTDRLIYLQTGHVTDTYSTLLTNSCYKALTEALATGVWHECELPK